MANFYFLSFTIISRKGQNGQSKEDSCARAKFSLVMGNLFLTCGAPEYTTVEGSDRWVYLDKKKQIL